MSAHLPGDNGLSTELHLALGILTADLSKAAADMAALKDKTGKTAARRFWDKLQLNRGQAESMIVTRMFEIEKKVDLLLQRTKVLSGPMISELDEVAKSLKQVDDFIGEYIMDDQVASFPASDPDNSNPLIETVHQLRETAQ